MKRLFQFLYLMIAITSLQADDHVQEAQQLHYQPARFGDYEVHYSAFNSTFISPEIAGRYKFERSSKYGIINIAIRKVKNSDSGKAVTGRVKGNKQNLLSQKSNLEFQEVQEAGAIYYLASFPFSGGELLKFSIDVTPNSSAHTETIRFEQKFYQEE